MSIPLNPPVEWFAKPEEGIPTDKRITITADGRAFGYIALWDSCHVGMQGCVKPPKGSPTQYEYAHQGETITADGSVIRTAVIGGGAGHAPVNMDSALVPAYYDNSGTQLMRVKYGEDENGIWFAGALWPDVSELDVAHIRASSLSGDWRWHASFRQTDSGYDFAGSCLVNIPGFAMDSGRGSISNRTGRPFSLAASGAEQVFVSDTAFVSFDDNLQASGVNMCDGGCNCGGKLEVEMQASAALDADGIAEVVRGILLEAGVIQAAASEPTLEDRVSKIESDLEAEALAREIAKD